MVARATRRREFLSKAAIACLSGVLGGCDTILPVEARTEAAELRRVIDTNFYATLERLYIAMPGSRDLVNMASGVLVFPTVVAAGADIDIRYGAGALRVANTMVQYYSFTSSPENLQNNPAAKSVIFLLMGIGMLNHFRTSDDWFVGVDSPVRILTSSTDIRSDDRTTNSAMLAIVLDGSDLVTSFPTNFPLNGAKISPLDLLF